MKDNFPRYGQSGNVALGSALLDEDHKVLDDFQVFCEGTAGRRKVLDRRSHLLQTRDIIEKPFKDWQLEDLRGFLAVLNRSDRKPWTKKGILITLQMFLRWRFKDWSERFNNLDDCRKLSRLVKPNNSDRYNGATLPTAEEVDRMIRSTRSIRNKVYVSMAFEAGLPPAVQLKIRWKNLRIDWPEPGTSTLEYLRTKNQHAFVFPFSERTTYYLKRWQEEYEYPNMAPDDLLFPSPVNRAKPWSGNSANSMLKRLARRAGIQKPMYQYLLRHARLSESYELFSEEIHRKLFGHVPGSHQTKTYSHQHDKEAVVRLALGKFGSGNHQRPMSKVVETGQRKEHQEEFQQVLSLLSQFGAQLMQLNSTFGVSTQPIPQVDPSMQNTLSSHPSKRRLSPDNFCEIESQHTRAPLETPAPRRLVSEESLTA